MTGYLRYIDSLSPSGKTKVVIVSSVSSGALLGFIRWYGQWRCYTFRPEPDTIWNIDCLSEIQDKIRALNDERKKVSDETVQIQVHPLP